MNPKESNLKPEDEKTPYVDPEIIHEIELEVRAGSVADELPPGLNP